MTVPPDCVLIWWCALPGLVHLAGHFLCRVTGIHAIAILIAIALSGYALIIGCGVVGASAPLEVVQRPTDIPAQAVQIGGD